MKNRIEAIDLVKGVAIVLVIFGHLSFDNEIQRILVYSFHMPLFMILSGFCFHGTHIRQTITKSIKRYLLPAYATLLLDITLYFVLHASVFPSLWEWVKTITLYGGMWRNIPIWFLFTLTLCQVIVLLLSKISRRAITISILLLAAVDVLPLPNIGWWVTATLFALPFFALGYLVRETDVFNYIKNLKQWKNACMLVAFLAGSLWNGYTDMYTLTPGKSYLLFAFTGLVGTVLLLQLADYIVTYHTRLKEYLSFLGRNTFLILITHYYICRIAIPITLSVVGLSPLAYNLAFQIIVTCVLTCTYMLALGMIQNLKQRTTFKRL